ncbi:hypothetical protein [Sphingobacterium haloxyli]|uniref:DUF4595 domain-containing protein n=1 Tax=Sphingobacterium haloxyli TaxID=2100533 RepID=A0A2S9J8R6_9SPHI|nr:hypothetical protein [Sphingobacterium haloxyli]PRD49178.1 hypothetical protein C5745_00620 [Sphingobacterium haloxyli]
MKRLLYIVFICGLLTACASDDMEALLSDRISSMETVATVGYGLPSSGGRLTFAYDEQGRLKKVNDKVFYYGTDGKVAYSRVFLESPHPHGKAVYMERLSYHWDERGRLKEVYLDSLYKKTPAIPGGISIGDSENLLEDILLSTYTYEGINRKPSTVVYRPLTRSESNIIAIKAEERIDYRYSGENPSSSLLMGIMDASISPISHEGRRFQLTTVNTYLPNIHPLARLYKQLGFHPTDLAGVIPLNCVSTIQREIETEDVGETEFTPPEGGGINWIDAGQEEILVDTEFGSFEGKATYSYRFNVLELPTEIVGEGNGIMQRTVITYE